MQAPVAPVGYVAPSRIGEVHVGPSRVGRAAMSRPRGTEAEVSALHAKLDDYGFLSTPFRTVKRGKLTDEVVYLRADEERGKVMAPADVTVDSKASLTGGVGQDRP